MLIHRLSQGITTMINGHCFVIITTHKNLFEKKSRNFEPEPVNSSHILARPVCYTKRCNKLEHIDWEGFVWCTRNCLKLLKHAVTSLAV